MGNGDLITDLPFSEILSQYYLNAKTVMRTGKWRLMLKTFKILLKSRIFGKTPLRFANIAISYDCNLNCSHCSAAKLKKRNAGQLSLDDYKKIARDLKESDNLIIDFTGGEPTICPRLEKIIPLFDTRSTYIILSTNGNGPLSKEQLGKYKEMGVDCLMISIDSMISEEHDKFRNRKGALAETLETIRRAKSLGFSILICAVVHHGNIRSKGFQDIIRYAKNTGSILVLILSAPAGKWSDFKKFKKDFMLTKEDQILARRIVLENNHVRFDFESNFKTWGCPAGKERVYITPYGEVLPCPFIHISFGNVKNDKLLNIRNRMMRTREFTGYSKLCMASENKHFINNCLSKTFKQSSLPISYEELKLEPREKVFTKK